VIRFSLELARFFLPAILFILPLDTLGWDDKFTRVSRIFGLLLGVLGAMGLKYSYDGVSKGSSQNAKSRMKPLRLSGSLSVWLAY
jgi:hypothetical protein